MPCIRAQLQRAVQQLQTLPQSQPHLEARLLLSQATGWSQSTLLAWPERLLSPRQQADFQALIQRRCAGEPIAYLRKQQAFWTLDLRVSPATLIPRPETELLVEIALESLPAREALCIADLGTGSGAIAAALATERPRWQLLALEREVDALAIAAQNFRRYRLANVAPLQAHWLEPIGPARLQAILSNPPYIPQGDPHLRALRYEPSQALVAGVDGLQAIHQILRQAPSCLVSGGLLALEHGFDQGAAVRALFQRAGFSQIETRRDLSGQPRVTLGFRP